MPLPLFSVPSPTRPNQPACGGLLPRMQNSFPGSPHPQSASVRGTGEGHQGHAGATGGSCVIAKCARNWSNSWSSGALTSVSPGPNSIRILAVDDQPRFREGIAIILATLPDMNLVAQACNGHEAIVEFRTHRPDITLMDLQMSGMNGLDAVNL